MKEYLAVYFYDAQGFYTHMDYVSKEDTYVYDGVGNIIDTIKSEFIIPEDSTTIVPQGIEYAPRFDKLSNKWIATATPPEPKPPEPTFNAEEAFNKVTEELGDLKAENETLKNELSQLRASHSKVSSSLQNTRYYLTLALPGMAHLFRD